MTKLHELTWIFLEEYLCVKSQCQYVLSQCWLAGPVKVGHCQSAHQGSSLSCHVSESGALLKPPPRFKSHLGHAYSCVCCAPVLVTTIGARC